MKPKTVKMQNVEYKKTRGQELYEATTQIKQVLTYRSIINPIPWESNENAQEIFDEIKAKYLEVCSSFNLKEEEIQDLLYNIKNKVYTYGEEGVQYYDHCFFRTNDQKYRNNAEALKEARSMLIGYFYENENTNLILTDSHYVWFLHEIGIIDSLKLKFPDITQKALANLIFVISNGRSNLKENIIGLTRKDSKFIGTTAAKKTTTETLKKLKLK